jgi:hypothetical protein
VTADARRREKAVRAALREPYGQLGARLEPGETYQVVSAAGRRFAIHWTAPPPDELPRRLPASFSLYSLHYRQRRYGWQPRENNLIEFPG